MAKKKVSKKEDINNEYTFTLKIADSVFTSSNESPEEALHNLPKPLKISHKGVLTVEQGGKKKELLLNVEKMKRLYYPLAQKFLLKYLIRDLK